MGLDVWFREDLVRALQAAQVAGRQAQSVLERVEASASKVVCLQGDRQTADPAAGRSPLSPTSAQQKMDAYWQGYEAALATIGTAFGLGESGESYAGGPSASPVAEPGLEQAFFEWLPSSRCHTLSLETTDASGELE